jgi:hypothetical protein
VTVNGLLATVSGTQWVANHVPLQPGPNILVATATDAMGNTATTSVTVQSTPSALGITLTANLTSGTPPLEVRFSYSAQGFGPGAFGVLHFGDGGNVPIELLPLTYSYPTEGLYKATLTVTDTHGQTATDTLLITVLSRAQMEALFKAKWEGLKAAIQAKDLQKALQYFAPRARPRYEPVLPLIMERFSEAFLPGEILALVFMADGRAECELLVPQGGKLYSYPVYFTLDPLGIWRIQQY